MERRKFLYNLSLAGAGLYAVGAPTSLFGKDKTQTTKLTILHTNDVHSRLDPFPMDGTKLQGMGGVSARTALIKKIRQQEKNVLLLDSGDILQGTPYFNFFKGKPEFDIMSEMGYDASTIGNHDFDAGVERLAELALSAKFPLLNTNYSLENSPLQKIVRPYKIMTMDDMKIGIFGIGIELKGLVPKESYGDITYNDPLAIANKTAAFLKKEKKCDLIICLSHIGYKYSSPKVNDIMLANNSKDIDIILGGHTHTFLDKPDLQKNLQGETVLINQVGWAGLRLGRLDIVFEKNNKKSCVSCDNMWVRD